MGCRCAFLLGCIVLVSAVYNTLAVIGLPAIISAAAAAVSAGTSLAGVTLTGLMDPSYKVSCGIEVENWTKFPLIRPVVKIAGGALSVPPRDILPSKREAMVARKTSNTATGTYGTVSWLVAGKNRRIVIMWSAPYDFNMHSNWLGVGITSYGVTSHADGNEWFNQMYYGDSSNILRFNRKEYYWESSQVIYSDDLIEISGSMSTGHQAQVKITVRPVDVSNLAAPIIALLQK